MGVRGVAGVVAEPCDFGEEDGEGDGEEEEEMGDVGEVCVAETVDDAPSARETRGDAIFAASVLLLSTALSLVNFLFPGSRFRV